MTSWCDNGITIYGPYNSLVKFKEVIEQSDADSFSFLQTMMPMPTVFEWTDKEAGEEEQKTFVDGCNNWYDWRVKNWGCKWDISTEGLEFTDNKDGTATIEGDFESPYVPPLEAFNTFVEANQDCTLELFYNDPAICFVGKFDGAEGAGSDTYYEYGELMSNEVRETIGEELDDYFLISEDSKSMEEQYFQEYLLKNKKKLSQR